MVTPRSQNATEYLRARGLTVEIARRAGVEVVVNAKTAHAAFKAFPALAIRYFNPWTNEPLTYPEAGKAKNFLRVRYLDMPKGFFHDAKPQRFAQPKGSPVFAYFAPGGFIDWRSTLSGPSTTIVVVEGEIKGLCACAHGIPTIALGGVDSFKNSGVFLPELESVVWNGRDVIVCYDSDISDKVRVQAAEKRLAAELKKRGATVYFARLPSAEDGSKLGLDDVIARYGRGHAERLLLQAQPVSEFEAVIDLAPHRLVDNLDALDDAFVASSLPIFQRSGRVVHVAAAAEQNEADEVRRATDAPIIHELSVSACQQLAMRAAKFTKWNATKKAPVPTECPPPLAEHYIRKVDEWKLDHLNGVAEAPTIRSDGTIVQSPGYDIPSGILLLPNAQFPQVLDAPRKGDALVALKRLRHLVRGFEFATPEAEAVWVAAAMTAVIRRSLRTAPLFAISAPVMGAGKTLAADLVSIIATGHEPAVMSQGRNPDEDRKRLFSVLMRGDSVVQIDNCEAPIEGDALCATLTSPEWQDRVLGRSEMITVPTNATFLATGNNITFRGDMSTRALMCKILPNHERPEERVYDWDARAEARVWRPQLVADILTIIRTYVTAKSPEVHVKPFGRFEEWQAFVQHPLIWLGAADPCKTRDLVERNDPERETFAQFTHLWSKVFGQKEVQVREIGKLETVRHSTLPEARELYELACEISGPKGRDVFNAAALGKYLVGKEERLSGGHRLIQGKDKKRKVATWRLVQGS